MEQLCCGPKTNTMLYVNYISKTKFNMNLQTSKQTQPNKKMVKMINFVMCIHIFILFFFGCVGSSLLRAGFL